MGVVVRVAIQEVLPRLAWAWEPETDILAGGMRPAPEGASSSLELSGHDGSVVVVDLADGHLAGLDVVVWPEVATVPGLTAPVAAQQGQVMIRQEHPPASAEVEVMLAVRASTDEDVIHLRVGAPRPTAVVQVADHLAVEIDQAGGLAGFWLTGVPPLTGVEDPA